MATGRTPLTNLLSHRINRPALAADAGAASASWAVVAALSAGADGTRPIHHHLLLAVVVVGATLIALHRRGAYRRRTAPHRTEETADISVATLSGAAGLVAALVVADLPADPAELLWLPVAFCALVVTHGYRRTVAELQAAPDDERERVVIVGAGSEAAELVDLVEHHPESGLAVIGVVGEHAVATRHGLEQRWLGPVDRIVEVLAAVAADSVIVTSTGFRGTQFKAITTSVLAHGYLIRISTGVSRWRTTRLQVDSMVHEPLLAVRAPRTSTQHLRIKRVGDVAGAAVLLVCTAPLMVLAAAAIKMGDGGPVFFRQRRIGYGGTEFHMTKFRSMVTDAEARRNDLDPHNERTGPLFKLQRDPRVTRVGTILRETSIDELPQLFDVLRGDMSLVGPRPPLPEERTAFDAELERRFDVRPGITGLWQVEARDNASFAAYRRLDLHYVENWSLWLDVCIVLATFDQLLTRIVTLPLRRRRQRLLDRAAPLPSGRSIPDPAHPDDLIIDAGARRLAERAS